MTAAMLLQRCRDAAGIDPDRELDAEGLIGFFQQFRPDGRGLMGLFDDLPRGEELHERLESLFAAAGDDRRPQGGRDAYFIVRSPQPIEPQRAEQLAETWLAKLRELAEATGDEEVRSRLDPLPRVRVLEGIPPKHPKAEHEKAGLLTTLQRDVPGLVERIEPRSEAAELLRQAYYFINCDAMLRDFLMWPLYADAVSAEDPFAPYFGLWKHGVKYRVFQEDQVDFYLPRL